MARRELSSREVVAAHLDRIEERDRALKAFTQVFRERALAEAERADKDPRRGPLHGLPVSVKENLDIAGEANTFGVVGRGAVRATRDAAMVTLLREAGAIVIGRTNLSQLAVRNPLRSTILTYPRSVSIRPDCRRDAVDKLTVVRFAAMRLAIC